MADGTLKAWMIILLVGSGIMMLIGHYNCYLPADRQDKIRQIQHDLECSTKLERGNEVVTYILRLSRTQIRALAVFVIAMSGVDFAIGELPEIYEEAIRIDKIYIRICFLIVVAIMFLIMVYMAQEILYRVTLRCERISIRNVTTPYWRDGIVMLEKHKNESFDRIMKKSRFD